MAASKSTKVPKEMEAVYANLVALTDAFCAQHLNAEYAELARLALAALCRKRPSPVLSGQPKTWACAVVYVLGQINYLTDRASEPCRAMADVCAGFGVAGSTASAKAKVVREALRMGQFDPQWMLPGLVEHNPMVWLLMVDGFMVDVRFMSREIQEIAFVKGLIPYIPADQP